MDDCWSLVAGRADCKAHDHLSVFDQIRQQLEMLLAIAVARAVQDKGVQQEEDHAIHGASQGSNLLCV